MIREGVKSILRTSNSPFLCLVVISHAMQARVLIFSATGRVSDLMKFYSISKTRPIFQTRFLPSTSFRSGQFSNHKDRTILSKISDNYSFIIPCSKGEFGSWTKVITYSMTSSMYYKCIHLIPAPFLKQLMPLTLPFKVNNCVTFMGK